MQSDAKLEPRYHVLLIGIDAYTVKPLHGCVNDIDAVQRLLIQKAGLPPTQIRRIASPHPGVAHETAIASVPATLENIRAALTALGSEQVTPGDRVFIYYSGHGARSPVVVGGDTLHRESLVPVDFNAEAGTFRLLYDFELNHLLAQIAARTPAFTFVLDCCHSTGATRELPTLQGMVSRVIDLEGLPAGNRLPSPAGEFSPETLAQQPRGFKGVVDDCHVIAACLNHELAQEAFTSDGIRQGLLTRGLLDELDAIPPGELRLVPWARIWASVQADVLARNPQQHPWMSGTAARAVLAGAPLDADAGLGLTRTAANEYRIAAGTLSGITKGARIAVYGDKPLRFHRLDSREDIASRTSPVLLEVIEAERSRAVARADGPPFDVPRGGRGRLVRAGAPERLPCAIMPGTDPLAHQVGESPLLELVRDEEAEVRLEQDAGGSWVLIDDIHGGRPGYPVLFTLEPQQREFARDLLEHYGRYALPLRMAKRCTDLPGALQLAVLACPADGRLSPEEAQLAQFPEAPTQQEFDYELAAGDAFQPTSPRRNPTEEVRSRSILAARAAAAKNGADTLVLDVGPIIGITDVFVITSGRNVRQVRTIADEIEKKLKDEGHAGPIRTEGLQDASWVLLDYGDFVAHIFLEETRDFYNLDRLWADAPRLDWEESAAAVS